MDKYREWPLGIPPKELQRKDKRIGKATGGSLAFPLFGIKEFYYGVEGITNNHFFNRVYTYLN